MTGKYSLVMINDRMMISRIIWISYGIRYLRRSEGYKLDSKQIREFQIVKLSKVPCKSPCFAIKETLWLNLDKAL